MPEGDILTARANDQVLSKKWTVRKDKHLDMCVLYSGWYPAGLICRSQVAGCRSLFHQYRKYPKHS